MTIDDALKQFCSQNSLLILDAEIKALFAQGIGYALNRMIEFGDKNKTPAENVEAFLKLFTELDDFCNELGGYQWLNPAI